MKKVWPYIFRIAVIALIIFLMYCNIEMQSTNDTQAESMGKQLKSAFSFFAGMGILLLGLLMDFIINLVKKRRGLVIFDITIFALVLVLFFVGNLIDH